MIERYRNFGGNSGVISYAVGLGYITVAFHDKSAYLYTDASAGARNVASMVALARRGQGLNGFINRVVRDRYAMRLGVLDEFAHSPR